MGDGVVRKFREEDRKAIEQITVASFEKVSMDNNLERMFGLVGGTDWKQRKVRTMNAEFDSDGDHCFVYELDGAVVGYITNTFDGFCKAATIRNVAVSPEHQKKGIGKALIEESLRHFRDEGIGLAKIETLEQNTVGQKFYPSLGFEEYVRQIFYAKKL